MKAVIVKAGRLLKVSFVLVLLLACGKKDSGGKDEKQDNRLDLKVMTYNVHHCNPPAKEGVIDVDAIANVIKKEAPDLVALQELDVNNTRSGVNLDQAKELGKLTGMNYYFAKSLDYKGGAYGVGILSKYPILESKNSLLPMKEGVAGEQRVVAWITVELENGKKIKFASTHFDTADHRLVQAQKIQDLFKNSEFPVVFGGDFNDTPGSEPINYLDKYFSRSCPKTCYNTIPADFATKAIDLIYYSNGAFEVVKNYTIAEKKASDHLPLVVQFKVN